MHWRQVTHYPCLKRKQMVNFAVLGCGRIGRMHARNIKAHPRADLVSVYDVVAKAATETADELGAKVVGSVDDALNDGCTSLDVSAFFPHVHVASVARREASRMPKNTAKVT